MTILSPHLAPNLNYLPLCCIAFCCAARAKPWHITPPLSCHVTISLLALRLSCAGWLWHKSAQPSLLLAITDVVDCCVLCCCHLSSWLTTTIIIAINILHLLASSFAPLLSCVPPPPPPIFRCGHRRRHLLRLPPTSAVFCLIVVCCWSSSLIVLVLSLFSSSPQDPCQCRRALLLLLHPFSVEAAYFSASSPFPP